MVTSAIIVRGWRRRNLQGGSVSVPAVGSVEKRLLSTLSAVAALSALLLLIYWCIISPSISPSSKGPVSVCDGPPWHPLSLSLSLCYTCSFVLCLYGGQKPLRLVVSPGVVTVLTVSVLALLPRCDIQSTWWGGRVRWIVAVCDGNVWGVLLPFPLPFSLFRDVHA